MADSNLTTKIFIPGNTAVITGASSGIGRATAIKCASLGMNVWMVDIDMEELTNAKEMVMKACTSESADGQVVETAKADVSDFSQVSALADRVFADGGKCHFLMNNAGIQIGGTGALSSMDIVHKTLGVNTYGPMHGCVSFVPKMKGSGEAGLVVNTGSKQGITMPPGDLSYNVSKAALKTYTEGLEHELMKDRREKGGKIHAALLVPGWVNSAIMRKSVREKAKKAGEEFDVSKVFFHEEKPADGAWMPSQVVDFMLEELGKGRFYIICPDNDVDRETDNLRMTWTMQDITKDRVPLSRWHPDYKDKFAEFLKANKESS